MDGDRERLERERRRLRLMLDGLHRFRSGALAIGPVIHDLEVLLAELELVGEGWRREFVAAWSDLEIPYAVALDRLQPIPEARDATVAHGVEALERLVSAKLQAMGA